MNKEINKVLKDHESRLKELERIVSEKKVSINTLDKFEGLNGGISLLIKNNFVDSPKSLREISTELEREGYYYGIAAIAKALSVDFMKKKKILTRVKDGQIWKYVIRK